MDEISVSVSFIVTILGIAFPILLQVIAGLDEKYSSELIIDLFNRELSKKFFWWSLISSLICLLIWFIKFPPLIDLGGFNFIIENSATYLLIGSTIFLIVSFFFLVDKILTYYTVSKFVQYLIKKHGRSSEKSVDIYFTALSDLMIFSIKKQNDTIAKTLSEFMYNTFQNFRNQHNGEEITYPSSYYELVNKSIEELLQIRNKKFSFLEYRTGGAVWILGELPGSKISKVTYDWLWRNILLSLEYERDDMIVFHWEMAHQFMGFQLSPIDEIFSEDFTSIVNENEIKNRRLERERFLEFHYALGGLLIYCNRYDCLNRIFKYTTSIPPRYELLPQLMDEIFNIYIKFRDPYDTNFSWISNKYPFPRIEGLTADGVIKKWICEYVAVLLLRQYGLRTSIATKEPLEPPSIPSSQREKQKLLDNLPFFEKLVNNVLENKNLLTSIGLNFISDKWCADKDIPTPTKIITDYKLKLESSIEQTFIEQDISDLKVSLFNKSTLEILKKTMSEFSQIGKKLKIESDFNAWFIHGTRTIIDKSAFSEDQTVSYLNFDSVLAQELSHKYSYGIAETFFLNKTDNYVLKPEDISHSVDRMKNQKDDFIIIGFGLNIKYLQKHFRNLTDNDCNGIAFINFNIYDRRTFGNAFYILRKEHLPYFIYKELTPEQKLKYSLSCIDEDYNIYSSITDLNKNDEIRNELSTEQGKDLRKSALLNISILTEIRWRKNIKNTLIKTYFPYVQEGLPNTLSDVKEF